MGRAVNETGGFMKTGLIGIGIAAGAALIGVGVKSTEMAGNFQQSMLKVGAYAGLSKQQMDSMGKSILDMAAKVGQSPQQLADAIYPIVSSGYSAADALNILNLSAKTAAASGAQTSVVADALTTSLGAMHAPASQAAHYMDMLNKMVSVGKGEVPQYASVIGKLSLAASSAHVDFATMGASLADLTTHGFPSVAQASTALGNLFTQVGVKTDAMAQHAKKLGLSFDEQKFSALDLTGKLNYLQTATGGNQGELLKLLGGSQLALKAFQALQGSTGDLKKDMDAMGHSTGATDSAFQTASSGMNASMNRLKASFQVGMIEIGQKLLPLATTGMNLLNNALQGALPLINNVGGAFKSVNLGEWAAPLQNIGNLLKGELGREFKDLATDAQQVGQWFNSSVVPALKAAEPGFKSLGNTLLTTVLPGLIQVRSSGVDMLQNAFQKFAPIIEKVIPPFIKLEGAIAGNVAGALKFLMPYVVQAMKAIDGFANEIIDRVAPIVDGAFKAISAGVEQFGKFWSLIWGGVQQYLKGVWDTIVGVIKIAWALVTGIIKIGLDLLTGNWKGAWNDMKDMLGGIWDGIKTMFKGALEALGGVLDTVMSVITGKATDAGSNIVKGIANGITGAIKFVKDAINSVASWISAHLPHSPAKVGPLVDLPKQGAMITEQIGQGMLSNMPRLTTALAQLVKPISMSLSPAGALPAGTTGIPSLSLPSASSAGQPQTLVINIDGQRVARVLLPAIVSQIRYNVRAWSQ